MRFPAPRRRSSIESFLDDYQAVRLYANAVALVVTVAAMVGDWTPSDGLVAPRLAILAVIVAHALWCSLARVRAPKGMLLLDITLLGGLMLTIPGYTSVMTGIAGFLAVVVILFTERSRPYFLAYLTGWYSLAFLNGNAVDAARLADLFGSIFAVGAIGAVVIRMRTWLAELDAARSQMLGTVGHELRNSLTGVLGFTRLAAGADEDSQSRDLVEAAYEQAVDANEIVEDLLTASRVEASALRVKVQQVDVNEEAATVVRRFHDTRHPIRLELADGLPSVTGDALRLRQALRNLVSNALRYGGSDIAVITRAAGEQVQVVVRDNGDGVPVEEEATIFLPYRRSSVGRQNHDSIGLGLWICRHLAQAMGGDLEYRRNPPYTDFVLTLPVHWSGSDGAIDVSAADVTVSDRR